MLATLRPLAILVTGDPLPRALAARGSFTDMIRRGLSSSWTGPLIEVDCRSDRGFPEPSSMAGFMVTGSAASITERTAWMRRSQDYLRRLVDADVAVLGICFGHQLLAEALGGRVDRNPKGRQVGTLEVSLSDGAPLVEPRAQPLLANVSHQDAVVQLPPGARVHGVTPRDPCAVVEFGKRAWGVQFHPEFDECVMRAYIEERRQVLLHEGFDVDALSQGSRDTPASAALLGRFVSHVAGAAPPPMSRPER